MAGQKKSDDADKVELNPQLVRSKINIENALEYYKSVLGTWVAISEETSQFVNKRLREDLKLTDEIRESTTAMDAAEVQSRFFGRLYLDYSNEMQKLMSLASQIPAPLAGELPRQRSKKKRRSERVQH